MRIIKEGKPASTLVYTGTCQDCGCQLEAEAHEVQTSPDQRDAGWRYVECPQTGCKQKFVTVKPK